MTGSGRTWAAVLAGGFGRRVGSDRPKQLLDLGGLTVVERSVAAFHGHGLIDGVVLVVPSSHRDEVASLVPDTVRVVEGGAERSDSTRAAVRALLEQGADPTDGILVHDAARPLVSERIITDCVRALETHDVVATLVTTPDTIVRIDPATGAPGEPLPRAALRRHQTPQGFRLGVLDEAHRSASQDGSLAATDDCTLVMYALPQVSVGVVAGDHRNLKITDATDLVVARALLEAD
ncbi:2-C-methyl-D-erythritol 4-phosphate cytidylyltransferase [Aeromicrobium sp. CF4.19]|uniref:IspD/TarI family cytidylyltransferase n=1 Tax=Aeromicrobium sp. CF4.19 TaxID=3373082 RepID=UPI003EE6EAF1